MNTNFKIHRKRISVEPIRGERTLSIYLVGGTASLSVRATKELHLDDCTYVLLANDGTTWYLGISDNESGFKLSNATKGTLSFSAKRTFKEMAKPHGDKKTIRYLIAKESIEKEELKFYELIPLD